MGANGSGKSTAALCMNGMLVPSAGSITVDGMDTADTSVARQIRRRVGLVFQDPNLQFTSMSVERELAFGLENVGVPTDHMREQVDDQLRQFRLEPLRKLPPSALSGGEKQRLAVASVMVLRPSYLILDESTSLLSPASRRSLLDLATNVVTLAGSTLVTITQFPQEALEANRLIVLHKGAVVYDDTPDQVFRNAKDLMGIGIPIPLRMRFALDEL
jgi:energy-coupling factor transporter ATP-binding protein EcfA2